MNKLIVTVFDNETTAFEGLTAIKELHSNGDLSLYAVAVINKNEEGEVTLKEGKDQGPIGTAVAALAGAFIGLLGGPVGVAAGATAGALGGIVYDINTTSVDLSFAESVGVALEEGKTAIVAEVDESWSTPLDTRMEALGAMVFRRNKAAAEYDLYLREDEALEAELEELNEELEEATAEAKEKIQAQIKKVKAKQAALQQAASNTVVHLKAETDAKIAKIQAQLSEASSTRKAKLEKRKAKLEETFEVTQQKFAQLKTKAQQTIKKEPATV